MWSLLHIKRVWRGRWSRRAYKHRNDVLGGSTTEANLDGTSCSISYRDSRVRIIFNLLTPILIITVYSELYASMCFQHPYLSSIHTLSGTFYRMSGALLHGIAVATVQQLRIYLLRCVKITPFIASLRLWKVRSGLSSTQPHILKFSQSMSR